MGAVLQDILSRRYQSANDANPVLQLTQSGAGSALTTVTGAIVVGHQQAINARNSVDGDYFTIGARDSDTDAIVEVARVFGASNPYFSFGGSQQFKFYNDGTADFGVLMNLVGDARFLGAGAVLIDGTSIRFRDTNGNNGMVWTPGSQTLTFPTATMISPVNDADGYYLTIGARDSDTDTIVEVARAFGAADPYFSMGGSQQFKFYNSGVATVGQITQTNATILYLGGVVQATSDNKDAIVYNINVTGADATTHFHHFEIDGNYVLSVGATGNGAGGTTAPRVDAYGGLYMMADALYISAPNTDSNYTIIGARDNGVGIVEIARLVGAADPYFAFGGSQQVKHYNSGLSVFGADVQFETAIQITSATGAIRARNTADGDYFTIEARDSDTDALVEVGRVVGATDPYLSMGGSQQFKFYNSGAADFGNCTVSNLSNLQINNTAALQAANTDGNYFTVQARDSGVGLVNVIAFVGAADPYTGMGGNNEFKFYNSGVADFGSIQSDVTIGLGANDTNSPYVIFTADNSGTNETAAIRLNYGTDPYLVFEVSASSASPARVDAMYLKDTTLAFTDNFSLTTNTADDDLFTIKAVENTGNTLVEVARAAGAVAPYFSLGGSQEFKFYNGGTADLNGTQVNHGVSCNIKRFYQEITLDTGDAETAVGLTPGAVILSAAIRVSVQIVDLDSADHHIQLGINGSASKYIDVAQGAAATTIDVNKKGNYTFNPTVGVESSALVLTITGGADQIPSAGKVYVEVIYLDSSDLADA